MTTYNRPEQLAKTLPQIAALGAPVLVVDDGSDARLHAEGDKVNASHGFRVHVACCDCGIEHYIRLHSNRGLACALNIGLSYWLADPEVEFISVFQDDCDIDPDLHRVMLEVCRSFDRDARTLFTGFDAIEHGKGHLQAVQGIEVYEKQTGGGVHLFGRRHVWESLMPIPSLGVGLPRDGMGSRVDFNLTSHARGGAVPLLCVPGLVSHRAWKGEDSTWCRSDRVCGKDGPLDRSAIKGWVPA
ncbi:MAG: glycosyltransferase family 2 protein [Phycisphaerales bacterium JB064]